MIRDEQEFATKIKSYLDDSVAGMRPGTLYRLREARARALAGVTGAVPATAAEVALHGAGGGIGGHRGWWRRGWLGLAGVVVVGALFLGYQDWRTDRNTREITDLDVQILTSDLPIDAYVDRGFQTWLTSFQR